MPPPKQGRPPFIPDDKFELLCQLIFTLSAIVQANGNRRLTRTKLASLLGEIINHKQLTEKKEPMDEISLMKRIKQRNSIKQENNTMCRQRVISPTLAYILSATNELYQMEGSSCYKEDCLSGKRRSWTEEGRLCYISSGSSQKIHGCWRVRFFWM